MEVNLHTDEKAIEGILKQLEGAWNTSDSRAYAAPFAEDAQFIHIFGGQLDGRSAIEASHRVIFDTIYQGSRSSFALRSIRYARPDVAIVFVEAHVTMRPGSPAPDLDARPTMVMVKEQGKWSIVALQNTRVSEIPAAAQAAARLAT